MAHHHTVKNAKNRSTSYRLGVGIMLINDMNKVFVGKRIDQDPSADYWQMPQGGIDHGEDPITAAMRELKEEIGTNEVEIIAESADWLQYDIPEGMKKKLWQGKYRGQMQKWFLCKLNTSEDQINISTEHPEFIAWRWESIENLPDVIIPFKKDLYESLIREFGHIAASI
ncbi:MAG: RNA pyrophosphohydrolase [Alphaproteobacteria bacterium]|jgi:putative (di)nucleoside polyphosphate hydrolase|nr:RNA pyrophosphohydrolase [Candidatus Jidaibacter sp.]